MVEKILIVDDDVDSLKLIELMLKRQGYDVVTADSGTKGLARAEGDLPDLIILDMMMPDMSGLEVCKRLRANPNTGGIPIIMFTAKTLLEDKVKGFEAGVDDYLTKPTHPAELASRVKAMLARKDARPEPVMAGTRKQGMAIGVMGSNGGAGTTTVAVNIAAALLQSNANPILADFRPGVGSLGLMLGSNSEGMATIINKSSIDIEIVEREVVQHKNGLRALLCSSKPREAQIVFNHEKAVEIMRIVRNLGNPAIFDLGYGLSKMNVQLIAGLDKLLFVLEANSVALDIAKDHLSEIDTILDHEKVGIVVVNRSNATLSWYEVESVLGREIEMNISAAPELAFQALENRQPMVLLQRNAMVSGQYIKLANIVLPLLESVSAK